VLWDQLIPRCYIDRLSWQRFPEKQFLDMKQFELDALVKLNQRTF
jgi:hypothetical protein